MVLYHCARHVDQARPLPALRQLLQCGHAGVDLFFVLSGFVILYVHAGDIGRPGRARHYVWRRASRVLPAYWVALAVTVALGLAAGHGWPPLGHLAASAALLPTLRPPVLGVAWTLQFEAMFYIIVLLLILNARAGAVLLAGWALLVAAGLAGLVPGGSALLARLSAAYNLEFMLGMGIAWLALRGGPARPGLLAAVGLGLLALTCAAEDAGWLGGYGAAARLAYGVPAAALIAGIVGLDSRAARSPPALLAALGRASYAIYLFQFVAIGLVWQAMLACHVAQTWPAWLLFCTLSAATLAGGVLAAAAVERPLLRLLRRRTAPQPAAPPASPRLAAT